MKQGMDRREFRRVGFITVSGYQDVLSLVWLDAVLKSSTLWQFHIAIEDHHF